MALSNRPSAFSRRVFLSGSAAMAGLAMIHPFSARAQSHQAHLRLMGTTDLHVHIYPYDYYADREIDTVGLARTAAHIAAVRGEAANALLFDNGDFLQGNPMGDYIAYERGMEDGRPHPVVTAMNTLRFDAGTLGNHEFDYGLEFLARTLEGATFPVVSANVVRGALGTSPVEDDHLVQPYAILDREIELGDGSARPIRIGIIGFAPPQIMVWGAQHLAGRANAREIVEAAEALVPVLRREGVDLVVALSHSGIAADGADSSENASLQLAGVEGIDVVMTGHQHRRLPGEDFEGIEGVDAVNGTLAGKPAIMAGFWGSDLGVIDLLLEHDGEGWRVASSQQTLRSIFERVERETRALVTSDEAVLASVSAEHQATLDYVRTPVGETSAPLHSYFALVADDPSVQIVNQAQIRYLRDILSTSEHADLPMLSAAAPFKSGGRAGPDYYTDIDAGPIAIRNVADLYLYPNTLQAVRITGADLREWLEMSAGIFNRITPGSSGEALISDGFPSYNFDVIDGVTYRIDVTQPARYDSDGNLVDEAAHRIVGLSYEGRPIDEAQHFIVATNNYRAGGGGNFPGIDASKVVFVAPDANRDVLVRYIVGEGTVNPAADGNWRFEPAPGTVVEFRTGPGSQARLSDVSDLSLEPAGETQDGYLRYRLSL